MDYYDKLKIERYINAHDTYTVYGGSRMSEQTLTAMAEASRHFVDIEELQRKTGAALAKLTRNEAAYVSNGSSGGLLLAACVCMARGSAYHYSCLPDTTGLANEIIVMRAQRNAYDTAILTSGAAIVEVGDADETLDFQLEGRFNERTAAVFYFACSLYARGSMPLEDVIRIAHKKGVPVVVDAAAQLPPVENLWRFTKMGADLVLFSGGKTLCGPQDSGLILGRAELIEQCVRFGAPAHGICRSSKCSREAIAGLYTAVEQYVSLNHEKEAARLLTMTESLKKAIERLCCERVEIVCHGPVGQTYPRVFAYLTQRHKAGQITKEMRRRQIYIGSDISENAIYISPLNLREEEMDTVQAALSEILGDKD